MDNGLNEARFELRLPKALAGLVRITPAGSQKPILTWRTAEAIDRIPVWATGVYRVSVGNRVFSALTAVAKA